jgi:hypothetical protein
MLPRSASCPNVGLGRSNRPRTLAPDRPLPAVASPLRVSRAAAAVRRCRLLPWATGQRWPAPMACTSWTPPPAPRAGWRVATVAEQRGLRSENQGCCRDLRRVLMLGWGEATARGRSLQTGALPAVASPLRVSRATAAVCHAVRAADGADHLAWILQFRGVCLAKSKTGS